MKGETYVQFAPKRIVKLQNSTNPKVDDGLQEENKNKQNKIVIE